MNDVIESLKELGLNSYEAKVYVALLKKYPATGYEVAKLADIPLPAKNLRLLFRLNLKI